MLFDLRGRGRRRTIQVIYVTLAILMGGGLVFFGIGGNAAGGLFDALGLRGGSGSSGGGTDVFSSQISQAQKALKANPRDTGALAQMARARYQQAIQGDSYDPQLSRFTSKGKVKLQQAANAWEGYLALNPPHPDDALAGLMIQAYAPSGLNEPAKGAATAEIITATRPSAAAFYQLAVFAFAANQMRKANLAAAQTLRLTPAARKTQTKLLLDQARTNAAKASLPGAASAQSATGQ